MPVPVPVSHGGEQDHQSSDEVFPTHPPLPPIVQVMARSDSPSSFDVAESRKRAHSSPLLIPRMMSDNESFSDLSTSDGDSSPPENDYGFQGRVISSSKSIPGSDNDLGDDFQNSVREPFAAYISKHNFSSDCTKELFKIFASAEGEGQPKAKHALVQTDRSITGEEVKFCVDLPVHTFDDFEKLEEELKESSEKRKVLVSKHS